MSSIKLPDGFRWERLQRDHPRRQFQSGQAVVGLAQIQEQEFVSGSRRKFMFLDVYATNPVTLALQFLYQVPTDETSGSAH